MLVSKIFTTKDRSTDRKRQVLRKERWHTELLGLDNKMALSKVLLSLVMHMLYLTSRNTEKQTQIAGWNKTVGFLITLPYDMKLNERLWIAKNQFSPNYNVLTTSYILRTPYFYFT